MLGEVDDNPSKPELIVAPGRSRKLLKSVLVDVIPVPALGYVVAYTEGGGSYLTASIW